MLLLIDKIDPVIFAKLSPREQADLIQKSNPDQIKELINSICKTSVEVMEDINENNQQLSKLEKEITIQKVMNFDASDLRLRIESDLDSHDRIVNAEWHEDHIELYIRKWGWSFPPAMTLEYVGFVLNHEYLHQIIYKIMIEDDLYFDFESYEGHWPFYAGEIDLIYGVSTNNLSRDYYEDIESIRNTNKLLTNCSSKSIIDLSKWTWL